MSSTPPTPPPEDSLPAAPPTLLQTPAAGWATIEQQEPTPGPAPGLEYAGMGRRLLAFVIDAILAFIAAIVFSVILYIIVSLATGADMNTEGGAYFLAVSVVQFVVLAAYFILAWHQNRATVGQRLVRILVGNAADGTALTWRAAFIRWLALTLGLAPLLYYYVAQTNLSGIPLLIQLGWWAVLLGTALASPARQGLHDRWAQSLVVRRPR